jgi:hypothetical protein
MVVRKIPRSLAYQQGLKIFIRKRGKEITPDEARALGAG